MVKQFETEYVSYEELYLAYLACRQNKRRKRNAIIFEMDSYVELYELYCELNFMTYEVGTSIVFCVDYPTKREVFAANFRDRIIHHLLINRLTSYFEKEFIDDNYSCRIGKGTEYGIQRCYDKIKECSEITQKIAGY